MEIDNYQIAMSLLRQCAWVWEHCTRNANEGSFKLSEVNQGLHGRKRYESAPGLVVTEMELCQHWDLFVPQFSTDGGLVGFDRKTWETALKFGDFRFSYRLDNIFGITAGFCKWNCPNMAQKARFCCKGGERWAVLPELPKTKEAKPKAKAKPKKKAAIKPMSFAEQLRQALLARMAA